MYNHINLKYVNRSSGVTKGLLCFLLSFVLCISTTQLSAQNTNVKVSGVVTDKSGEPLIGVTVTVRDATTGTTTGIDGDFVLDVKKGSIIDINYIGFVPVERVIDSSRTLNIKLEESSTKIEDVVVVGYGAQKKESVVGAITQVDSEAIKSKGVVSNVTDALSGTMPGVQVLTATGMPGGLGNAGNYNAEGYTQSSGILIRGTSTWNDSSPLVMVDGMERDMNDIDPNEIETISVLKDASATAVYGVRGANGVILITTKRGNNGPAQISVEANYSMKKISRVADVLGSYDALLARNYAILNSLPVTDDTWSALYTPESTLNKYASQAEPEKYADVDWKDVMTKDFASSAKFNVTVRGGTDFVKYFTSLGYTYDGDIMDAAANPQGYTGNFSYKRFNFRSNLDFKLTNTTKFSVNLSGYIGNKNIVPNAQHTMWYSVYKHAPDAPLPIYSDGTYGTDYMYGSESTGSNGYKTISSSGLTTNNAISTTSDFSLEQDLSMITEGLSFKGRFSFDNYFTTTGRNYGDNTKILDTKRYDVINDEWVYVVGTQSLVNGFQPDHRVVPGSEVAAGGNSLTSNMYYNISLNYDRKFNDVHNVTGLMLFSRENYSMGSGFPKKREDWVGRLTYDYDNRYLAEVNAAYNGSEKFGDNYKFDLFPSLALGWRVDQEKFMDNVEFISNLKLKYSIGLVGNDNIYTGSQWPYITTYVMAPAIQGVIPNFGAPYTNFRTDYNTYIEGTPGNPNIRWEKALKQNIGIEMGLLNQAISVEMDVFNEHRFDMLLSGGSRSIPPYYGATAPAANIGEVKSNGIELVLTGRKKIGKVNTWASANWTLAASEIINKDDAPLAPDYQKAAGYTISQPRTQVSSGIIGSWNELLLTPASDSSLNRTQAIPGDYYYVDYDANGVINGDDSIPYGYPLYPRNTYGFSLGADYKGLSLSLVFYGVYNVNQNDAALTEFEYSSAVVYPYQIENTFTPEYGVSDPTYRTLAAYSGRNTGTGSAAMLDGSYLRLKTMQVSYDLPSKLVKSWGFQSIKVFVNGNNLLYWSDLPTDVEGMNISVRSYPNTKLINFGTNITF